MRYDSLETLCFQPGKLVLGESRAASAAIFERIDNRYH